MTNVQAGKVSGYSTVISDKRLGDTEAEGKSTRDSLPNAYLSSFVYVTLSASCSVISARLSFIPLQVS